MLDEDGNVRYLSPSATRILGYSNQDSLSLNPHAVIAAEDWPIVQTAHALATWNRREGLRRPGSRPASRRFLAARRFCRHQPSRRPVHSPLRAEFPRHHRSRRTRSPTTANSEDGSGRATGRRHCPRFQQHTDCNNRQCQSLARGHCNSRIGSFDPPRR